MLVLTGSPCNVRSARIHAANIFHMSMISVLLNLAVLLLTFLQLPSSKMDGASQHLPAPLSVQHLKNYIPIAISILSFEWDLLLSYCPKVQLARGKAVWLPADFSTD